MTLRFELYVVAGIWGVLLLLSVFLLYTWKNWCRERKYRAASVVLHLFPNRARMQIAEKLKRIYPGEREETLLGKYCLSLFLGIYVTVVALSVIFPIYCISSCREKILSDGNRIERRGYGEGDRDIRVKAAIDGDEKEVDISVSELSYTEQELAEKQEQAQSYIEEVYLGGNSSADNVKKPLNLVRRIPNSAISVSWKHDSSGIIGENGELANADLDGPYRVELIAVLKYEKSKKEISFEVTIMPQDKSRKELLWQRLGERFEKLDAATREKRFFALPREVDGHRVYYDEAQNGQGFVLPCIVIFAIILVPVVLKNNVDGKVNKREREIAADYPDFVDRFMLLISAGLTVKGAWYRISDEYGKKRDMTGKRRYLYEEMLVTESELENGVGELKAYEMFGKRMGLLVYLKFSNLLVQNLRKGTSDLLGILSYESANALSERKEQAKALGEEAGTKLLFPMMLNLTVVFGMIIYAAFQSI